MRRADLITALDGVPDFAEPIRHLEQVVTPATIAAEFLMVAAKTPFSRVLDLGCGTGRLAIGAALLGAKVTAMDVDKACLDTARIEAERLGVEIEFVQADAATYSPPAVDAVVMNPPFGAQVKHADRAFYACAAQTGAPIWFFALSKTERFLQAQARDLGRTLQKVNSWRWPLPAKMAHHTREVAFVDVGGYVMR